MLLRTGIVLSAAGGALAKQLPLFRLGVGGRIGSGRQYRSWITLDDQVGAILHCLGDGHPVRAGQRHARRSRPPTPRLATALGRALHRPSFLAVPAPALKLVLGSEMAADMVLASQRVLPAQLDRIGLRLPHPDLDEAMRSVLTRLVSRSAVQAERR